jgi:hypothetical protein
VNSAFYKVKKSGRIAGCDNTDAGVTHTASPASGQIPSTGCLALPGSKCWRSDLGKIQLAHRTLLARTTTLIKISPFEISQIGRNLDAHKASSMRIPDLIFRGELRLMRRIKTNIDGVATLYLFNKWH